MKPLRVLSLFDGISVGRLAMHNASIPTEYYHASEIEPYAKLVSNRHWPDIKQLGSVINLKVSEGEYDILIGGSPCQGFSKAGYQLNFNDPGLNYSLNMSAY